MENFPQYPVSVEEYGKFSVIHLSAFPDIIAKYGMPVSPDGHARLDNRLWLMAFDFHGKELNPLNEGCFLKESTSSQWRDLQI